MHLRKSLSPLLLASGALLVLLARAPHADPAVADPNGGCGVGCPASGVEVVPGDHTIRLSGRSLEDVVRSYRDQTRGRAHAAPDHPQITWCMRCGSTDHAAGISLRYGLELAMPSWEASAAMADEDQAAVQRFLAAVQGHLNRHFANHRDRLDGVAWGPLPLPEIEAAYTKACEAAIEADNALDAKEGCWVATTSLAFEAQPRSTCEPGWKPTAPDLCRIR